MFFFYIFTDMKRLESAYIKTMLVLAVLFSLCGCDSKMEWNNGFYVGETSEGRPSGFGRWESRSGHVSYEGFWKAGQMDGYGTLVSSDSCYRGMFVKGRFCGLGQLVVRGDTLYTGKWANGQRNGRGAYSDSLGRRIEGWWRCDTLVFGRIADSLGVYEGEVDSFAYPSGHGRFTDISGAFYEGHWENGVREDFGFAVGADGRLQVGVWHRGRFQGEQMIHNSDRIYGIDISRYQHIHKGRTYPIQWSNLRITGLGRLKSRLVSGKVDYPVSFVYIKSTQGTTVLNRYYLADYRSARKASIACGAYHFFSTVSDAAEQAAYFIKNTRFAQGDLPPVLDLEPTDREIERAGGAVKMFKEVLTWMKIVEKRIGVRPILYVNQMFVNKYLPLSPELRDNYSVWIARYGSYKPDIKLVHWQLSADGKVSGIVPEVDINVFNGYKDEFMKYLHESTIKRNVKP